MGLALRPEVLFEVASVEFPSKGLALVSMALGSLAKVEAPYIRKNKSRDERARAYFPSCQKSLLQQGGMVRFVRSYDPDSDPQHALDVLGPFVSEPVFAPEELRKSEAACLTISKWLHSVFNYSKFVLDNGLC